MSEDETTRLQAIRDALTAVQPTDKCLVRTRYEHGGGRMYIDGTSRSLILDVYEEGDREFYFYAVEHVTFLVSVLEAATMREQLALSLFRAEQAAKASAEAQLEAARQEKNRLLNQALAISTSLADFGIGPCSLPQGVTELGHRAESAEAQLEAARQEIAAKEAARSLWKQNSENWMKAAIEHGKRAESAEAQVDALTREHAPTCSSWRCGWEWRTENGAGVCRQPRDSDIHYVATVDSHAFVERLCDCGQRGEVDALTRAQAKLTGERDAYKRDLDAELDGNAAIRRRHGARDDESFIAFIDRLAAERATVDALTATLRALEAKWRKEVAGGWRNGVVIAIERCADDLAVLLDERGSR